MALKARFNPYTFARVSVMRSKLIPRAEYMKLVRMKIPEITRYLGENGYEDEIEKYAISKSGVILLEAALTTNFKRTIEKLRRISDDNLRSLIDEYLKKRDYWNLKTILRGKMRNLPREKIQEMLVPGGTSDEKRIERMLARDTPEGIIEESGIDASRIDLKGSNLVAIENALDKQYYHDLLMFVSTMPDANLRDYLLIEVDMQNLETVLKLKKANMEPKDIKEFLFYEGKRLRKQELDRMAEAKDVESAIKIIGSGPYAALVEKEGSLTDIKARMDRMLLRETQEVHHYYPQSINSIIAYMFAKELEIRNLSTIIKAKQLGLDEAFIESRIVV